MTILSPKTFLEWPDYFFILSILVLCVAISFYFKRKKAMVQKEGGNLGEFLLANRNLSVIPSAFSIAATTISGYALTTLAGEMFFYGTQIGFIFFSDCLTTILIAITVVPGYRKSAYVSCFQLLEERLDGCVRRLFSFFYIINKILFLGLVLYLPALSLTTLTPFDTRIITFVLGFVCTAYSSLGGLRTVVWTDVIQFSLMMTTMLMVSIQGSIKMEINLSNIWQKSISNGFLKQINWTEGEGIRYSIWAPITTGMVWTFDSFLINQATIQRVLSAKSISEAKRTVILSGILKFFFGVLLITYCSVLYLVYGQCSPMNAPEYTGVTRADQISVYAIGDLFQNSTLLRGVAISGIISASLSTFSSFINAFAAIALEDFVKPLFPRLVQNENRTVKLCVVMSFAFGTIAVMLAIAFPSLGNVIKVYNIILGIFQGPIAGIAFLLVFYKKLSKRGCLLGLAGAMLFNSWLIIGNALNVTHQRFTTLNITNDECEMEYFNVTSGNLTNKWGSNLQWRDDNKSTNNTIFMGFYKISFLWYTQIGFVAAIILGVMFSQGMSEGKRTMKYAESSSNDVEKHVSGRSRWSKGQTNLKDHSRKNI